MILLHYPVTSNFFSDGCYSVAHSPLEIGGLYLQKIEKRFVISNKIKSCGTLTSIISFKIFKSARYRSDLWTHITDMSLTYGLKYTELTHLIKFMKTGNFRLSYGSVV